MNVIFCYLYYLCYLKVIIIDVFYLDRNYCVLSFCKNGVICIEIFGVFKCNCVYGFFGVVCEGIE